MTILCTSFLCPTSNQLDGVLFFDLFAHLPMTMARAFVKVWSWLLLGWMKPNNNFICTWHSPLFAHSCPLLSGCPVAIEPKQWAQREGERGNEKEGFTRISLDTRPFRRWDGLDRLTLQGPLVDMSIVICLHFHSVVCRLRLRPYSPNWITIPWALSDHCLHQDSTHLFSTKAHQLWMDLRLVHSDVTAY